MKGLSWVVGDVNYLLTTDDNVTYWIVITSTHVESVWVHSIFISVAHGLILINYNVIMLRPK